MFRELTENKNKEKEIKKPSIQNQKQHLKPPGSDPTQPPSPSQIKEIVEKFENIKGNEHLKMKRPIFKKPEAENSSETKVKVKQVPATSVQISKGTNSSSAKNYSKVNPSHSSTKPSPGYTHKQPQIKPTGQLQI